MDLSDDSRPAYVQIADELRSLITSGQLGPGAKVPTARELMSRYDVASHTVQSALKILQDEGLTFSVHGRGTFVSESVEAEPVDTPDGDLVKAIHQLHEVIDRLQAQVGALTEEISQLRSTKRGR